MTNLIVAQEIGIEAVEYDGSLDTEPEELIKLSDGYKKHVPKLLAFIEDHKGECIDLLFKRIKRNGFITENIINCKILEVKDNGRFVVSTFKDLDGNAQYEDPQQKLIRTDSVMAIIPMLPNADIEPFEDGPSFETLELFRFLNEAIILMESCIGLDNASTLLWRYSKKNKFYREGARYFTEGKIIEVNNSNVKYDCVRISTPGYLDIIPHPEIDRFIAPDRYLQGFKTRKGEKHRINPWDIE